VSRAVHILVVDDEVGFARMLGHSLRRLGFDITLAAHPSDALELFREQMFDAVITDIDMPAMSGIELARSLREVRSDLPIAFCTGSGPGHRRMAEASSLGAVMPKVWREADVRTLLDALAIPLN
jgi:CheY-like chemotaxis protein